MSDLLKIKRQLDEVKKRIDENEQELEDLEITREALENAISDDEVLENELHKKYRLAVLELGLLDSGNDFINILRKLLPLAMTERFKRQHFNCYFVNEETITGTNAATAFKVKVDNIPDTLKGKVLQNEAAIDNVDINKHIIELEESALTPATLESEMIRWESKMDKSISTSAVESLPIERGDEYTKVMIGDSEFAFDTNLFSAIKHVFKDWVTVKYSAEKSPVLFKDDKSTVFICPMKV